MQIILLHPRLTRARTVTLRKRHVVLAAVLLALLVSSATAGLLYLARHYVADTGLSFLDDRINALAGNDGIDQKDRYLKRDLSAMAVKIGEMQARMMQLDALGERVQGLSGIKPESFDFRRAPGRGGAEPSVFKEFGGDLGGQLGLVDLQHALAGLSTDIESRADYLNVVETALLRDRIRVKMLPTVQPVDVAYSSSSFGLRIDPFTGRRTFHEGIDFPAPVGTPIVAAAGGVVIDAEYHYEFGNMLLVDHGNDIITRYAHASKLLVKVGDIVRRGQHIADVGSTGRSTGPHLHFEVLVKGVPQNPDKFLSAGADEAKAAALVSR
ncbi:MAG: M23 family metallopeptidase [Burkholderiaceae bacterium]